MIKVKKFNNNKKKKRSIDELLLLVAHWWSQIRSMALLLFEEKIYSTIYYKK
jgi:hypothetical protein